MLACTRGRPSDMFWGASGGEVTLISGAIIKSPALEATVPKHLLYSQQPGGGGASNSRGEALPSWGERDAKLLTLH